MRYAMLTLMVIALMAGCYSRTPEPKVVPTPKVEQSDAAAQEALTALAAARQIVVPVELMQRPDGLDDAVVDVSCANGVICGPIWPNSVCGGKSCIADEGEACCMICQCIGQLGKWCASPSGCTP